MGFYDLSKEERVKVISEIRYDLQHAIRRRDKIVLIKHFSDDDLYLRKAAYQGLGKIYNSESQLRSEILAMLKDLFKSEDELVRQTVVNTAGEIGMFEFEVVRSVFESGIHDSHHKVRNAVIGSVKKMGQKNPEPVLNWSQKYINDPDIEIRRQVCHGIELRGRTHPQDVLPLLKKLEMDEAKRVRSTLVHVMGQISYKKGCLQTVIAHLKNWSNNELIRDILDEIVDVHSEARYASFTALTQQQVFDYIRDSGIEEIINFQE